MTSVVRDDSKFRNPEAVPEPATIGGFYRGDQLADGESSRLEQMAQLGNPVSIEAIGDSLRGGGVILDVGAGPDVGLADLIKANYPKAQYLAVDVNPEAVQSQRAAGHHAMEGDALQLPVVEKASVVHARFVLGWFDTVTRQQAVQEVLRVSEDDARLVFIDYDWSAAQGVFPELDDLAKKLEKIMALANFYPDYGAEAAPDIETRLQKCGLLPSQYSISTERTKIKLPLEQAVDTIGLSIQPVIKTLAEEGHTDIAEELTLLLEKAQNRAANPMDSGKEVRLPDIVSTVVNLDLNSSTNKMLVFALRREVDLSLIDAVGPPELGVVRLSGVQIYDARVLHADSYKRYRYVTEVGTNEDDTLIEEIDPKSTWKNAVYMGALDPDTGNLMWSIRIIKKAETCEASAFATSSQNKDPLVVTKAMLAVACEARRMGYHQVELSAVRILSRILRNSYGDAFERVGEDGAQIVLEGIGLRPEGVRLDPYHVDLARFFDACLAYFRENPNEKSEQNTFLFERAKEYVENL